jgi:hypothetical protein
LSPNRIKDFETLSGRPLVGSSLADQLTDQYWEFTHTESDAFNKMKAAKTRQEKAVIMEKFFERPAAGVADAASGQLGVSADAYASRFGPSVPARVDLNVNVHNTTGAQVSISSNQAAGQ